MLPESGEEAITADVTREFLETDDVSQMSDLEAELDSSLAFQDIYEELVDLED